MAIDSKLKVLYDFLYHATSRTVHFSPNVLLRMGWFNKNDGPILFSIRNFTEYYSFFSKYYGTYLFIQFAKSLKKELKLDNEVYSLIKELEKVLHSMGEAPEIVTFEEMNFKRPEKYPFKILHTMRKSWIKKSEKNSFRNYRNLLRRLKKGRKKSNKLIEILTEIQNNC